MKEQTSMPVSKVGRAAKFMTTGVKVGGNYLKYFSKKAVRGDVHDFLGMKFDFREIP